MKTLLEKAEPAVDLLIAAHDGASVLHVFRGGVEITRLTGSRETVERVATERFAGSAVRRTNAEVRL